MGSRYLQAMAEFFGIGRYDCVAADGLDAAGHDPEAIPPHSLQAGSGVGQEVLTSYKHTTHKEQRAMLMSTEGRFTPFELHYAETCIIPEAAGAYRICAPDGEWIRTIIACVRRES